MNNVNLLKCRYDLNLESDLAEQDF